MPETPIRKLQVGQLAALEGIGLVRIAEVRISERWHWYEIDWTADPNLPRRPDVGLAGIWSAYLDDVPTIPAMHYEEPDHG